MGGVATSTGSGGMGTTGGMGGMGDPCKTSCDSCKGCVLVDYQGTATSGDCLIYVGCVLQCVGKPDCILNCKANFIAGFSLYDTLQLQCAELCGGTAGCQ